MTNSLTRKPTKLIITTMMLLSTLILLCLPTHTTSFGTIPLFSTTATKAGSSNTAPTTSGDEFNVLPLPSTVAVAGATGRTGSLVVKELLKNKVKVVAMVRDLEKAKDMFDDVELKEDDKLLKVVKCDLGSEADITKAVSECDAAIWCATGFSDGTSTLISKIKGFFGVVFPKQSIDSIGVPALAKALPSAGALSDALEQQPRSPRVVMCSSAGVTRPSWDEETKELFPGAADIPIVRLNPFNILNTKKDSEDLLRNSGVDYCIVRPCGLNDSWPQNSRPILTQGDVAVGRINRADVARILVEMLTLPSARQKTFEVASLKGYPPPLTLDTALQRLRQDHETVSKDELMRTYGLMQQLLPGEVQDSAGLAMGQTYEEMDQGKQGRLGKRGEEDAEQAAPKPSS